jgi:hypothetical protein
VEVGVGAGGGDLDDDEGVVLDGDEAASVGEALYDLASAGLIEQLGGDGGGVGGDIDGCVEGVVTGLELVAQELDEAVVSALAGEGGGELGAVREGDVELDLSGGAHGVRRLVDEVGDAEGEASGLEGDEVGVVEEGGHGVRILCMEWERSCRVMTPHDLWCDLVM